MSRRHAGRHPRVASFAVASSLVNLTVPMHASLECLFNCLYNRKFVGGNPRPNIILFFSRSKFNCKRLIGIERNSLTTSLAVRTITHEIAASRRCTSFEIAQRYRKRYLSVYISIFRTDSNVRSCERCLLDCHIVDSSIVKLPKICPSSISIFVTHVRA